MVTTLGCLNWPMMAASCRNLILSCSSDPSFSVFTATSTSSPVVECHTPRCTLPNWPEPRKLPSLVDRIVVINYFKATILFHANGVDNYVIMCNVTTKCFNGDKSVDPEPRSSKTSILRNLGYRIIRFRFYPQFRAAHVKIETRSFSLSLIVSCLAGWCYGFYQTQESS